MDGCGGRVGKTSAINEATRFFTVGAERSLVAQLPWAQGEPPSLVLSGLAKVSTKVSGKAHEAQT